jgi:TonB family protein
MKFRKRFSSLLVQALLVPGLAGAASTAVARGQQTDSAPTAASSTASCSAASTQSSAVETGATPAGTAKASATPPLTEEALRQRFVGKMVFIRGFYMADDLNFDIYGKVDGSPQTASFTLSALEVRKVSLSKKKLELEADRYALHFTGELPYEADSKSFDKVKISKKPVHITIERELVVVPKVKKEKDKDKKIAAQKPASAPAQGGVSVASAGNQAPASTATPAAASTATPAAASTATPAAAPPALAPGTTTSAAHSAMLMNAALDKVLATDVDENMMARLPDYWQQYFKSKQERHEFVPADPHVLQAGGDVTPPKVLNSIDPSSNEYAQKFGIAGLAMLRTVVDASGKPQEIAIDRPIGFGLDEKAVDAIKQSHFTPGMQNGHPVPVVIDLVVTFRIYSNRTKPGSVAKGSKQKEVVASAWNSDTSKTN